MFVQYAYLIGDSVLLLVLAVIFLFRRDLRKEILFISAIGLLFGLTLHSFFVNYWTPAYIFPKPFLLEDWLYGLVTAGIAASVYKFVTNKKFEGGKTKHYWQVPALIAGTYLALLIFSIWLGFNAIYVGSVYLLFAGFVALNSRRDLLINSFWSGLLLVLATMISYAVMLQIDPMFVKAHWEFKNLSGTLWLSIPIEEYLFAFFWGFAASCIYGYIFGLKLVSKK